MKTEVFVREGGKVRPIGTVGKGGHTADAAQNLLRKVRAARAAAELPVPLSVGLCSHAHVVGTPRLGKYSHPVFAGVRMK